MRMGLHTGEPAVGDERYVGLGVHRAARIGAAAHGGRCCSRARPASSSRTCRRGLVRDLGSYRLKDIDRPERLFQLDIEGLQADFPPLKAEKVAEPHPVRRRALLLSALAGVIAAAVAIPIFAFGQAGGGGQINAVDATRSASSTPPEPARRGESTSARPDPRRGGRGSGLGHQCRRGTVSRIDPVKRSLVQTIPVGTGPSGITTGNGAVWVANSLDGTVSRIDPATNTVVQTIHVGNGPAGIVYAAGSVWVANTGDGTITRIDADSGKPGKTLPVAATELAFGAGTLWASDRTANRVARIDPTHGKRRADDPGRERPHGDRLRRRRGLGGEQPRRDRLADRSADQLGRSDHPDRERPDSGRRRRRRRLGEQPVRRHAGADRSANKPGRAAVAVGNRPQGVAIVGRHVLVSVRQSGAGHRGGTLTVRMNRALASIDTAVAYDSTSWPFLRMTNDGLVASTRRRARGNPARARPRRLAADPDRRRQDVHVPAAAEHPLFERPAGQGVRRPLRRSSGISSRQVPVPTTTTASSARPAASRARSTATSRAGSWRTTRRNRHFPSRRARPGVPLQARAPLRVRRAPRGRRSQAPARTRCRPRART